MPFRFLWKLSKMLNTKILTRMCILRYTFFSFCYCAEPIFYALYRTVSECARPFVDCFCMAQCLEYAYNFSLCAQFTAAFLLQTHTQTQSNITHWYTFADTMRLNALIKISCGALISRNKIDVEEQQRWSVLLLLVRYKMHSTFHFDSFHFIDWNRIFKKRTKHWENALQLQ